MRELAMTGALVAALLFMLWPQVLHGGLARSLDWQIHAGWVEGFGSALREGVLIPRWFAAANGGTGAPAFVFYPPLGLYVGGMVVALGGSAALAVKVLYALAATLAVIATRVWLRRFVGPLAATLAAATFAASPLVALFVYRWNMPAGLMGLALAPLALWQVESMRSAGVAHVARLALAVALVVFAHLPTAFMLAFVVVARGIALCAIERNPRVIVRTCSALLLGVLASAHFVLPAVFEAGLVHHEYAISGVWQWRAHFLWSDPSGSIPGIAQYLPILDRVAQACAITAALAVAVSACLRTRDGARTPAGLPYGALLTAGALLMCTRLAAPIYEHVPGFEYLQFPWRWLPIAALGAVLSGASAFELLMSRARAAVAVVAGASCACLLGWMAIATLGVQGVRSSPTLAPLAWADARMVAEAAANPRVDTLEHRPVAMGPRWRERPMAGRVTSVALAGASARATETSHSTHSRSWSVLSAVPTRATLPILAYPGWRVTADGRVLAQEVEPGTGLIRVELGAGETRLAARFGPTPLRIASSMATLAVVSLLLLVLVRGDGRRGRTEASPSAALG